MTRTLPRTVELSNIVLDGRTIVEFGVPATKSRREVREYSVTVYPGERRFLMSHRNERTAQILPVPDAEGLVWLSLHDLAIPAPSDPEEISEGLTRIEQRLPFWVALDLARGWVTGGFPTR